MSLLDSILRSLDLAGVQHYRQAIHPDRFDGFTGLRTCSPSLTFPDSRLRSTVS